MTRNFIRRSSAPERGTTMLEYGLTDRAGDSVVLQLKGELAGELHADRLERVLEAPFLDDEVRVIRVDLSPLSFLDNHGVATLLVLHEESGRRGKRFKVERAEGQVLEKLALTGVLRVLQEGG
jgi:anti-anti-sigma factor